MSKANTGKNAARDAWIITQIEAGKSRTEVAHMVGITPSSVSHVVLRLRPDLEISTKDIFRKVFWRAHELNDRKLCKKNGRRVEEVVKS